MSADAGTTLNDRYRLEERIATGGMGEVWRARDDLLDRDVAVKVLKREYADDPTFLERFRAEARHSAGLAHPNVAGVFDYGEAGGVSYLVMELVRGEPLNAILARDGRLAPDRTLDIVAQAARGLEAAHQGGVIHRDVKPGNILVCPDGSVKLTDFGIARAADAVPLTQTGMVMGTAHYLSPEQANGAPVTFASDVYSLGVVAYECLAGQRPFDAETPVRLAMAHLYEDPVALPPDVPEAVSQLVARAMAKSPDDRFVSAAAFAQAADAVRAGTSGDPTMAAPAVGAAGADATMVLPAGAAAPTAATAAAPAAGAAATTAFPSGTGGWSPTPPPPAPRRRSRAPIVLVLTLLGTVLLGALAWSALKPAPPPPETTVPRLRGMTKAEAVAALDRRKLGVTEKTAFSDSVPRGEVITQDPAPGAKVKEGDDVSVTISRGPQPIRLPGDLIGRPVDDVTRELEKLGLEVRRQAEVIDRPFATVTSVSPKTGLRRGDTVTVRFSIGLQIRGDGKGDGKGDKKDEEKGEGKDD